MLTHRHHARKGHGLTLRHRIAVILKLGALAVIALVLVNGRPPATAQAHDKDDQRDINIAKMSTLVDIDHSQIALLNTRMEEAEASIQRFWGGVIVVGLLIGGSISLQFKRGGA